MVEEIFGYKAAQLMALKIAHEREFTETKKNKRKKCFK